VSEPDDSAVRVRRGSTHARLGLLCALALATDAQEPPARSTALLSPEARAELVARVSEELAAQENLLAAALVQRDPWRVPEPSDARLGVLDLAARGLWRDSLERRQAALLALDVNLLGPRRVYDHRIALDFCTAELATLALTHNDARDPAFHLERLELSLRTFLLPREAPSAPELAALLVDRLRAVPAVLAAVRELLTDAQREGVQAGIEACARLREVLEAELRLWASSAFANAPAAAPDTTDPRAELELVLEAARAALEELTVWLRDDRLPRATAADAVDRSGWLAVARARTGSKLEFDQVALALLAAIGEFEVPTDEASAEAPRGLPGPGALKLFDISSKAARNTLCDLGATPRDATQVRAIVRHSQAAVLPLVQRHERLDGSCWLELGLPGAAWPGAELARRERELEPGAGVALAVVHGSAGAGLRIGRRVERATRPQRLLADPCVDVGFGLWAAQVLVGFPHPQNPLRLLPPARAAATRLLRIECARLLAAIQAGVEQREEQAVLEDLARYAGIDAAWARRELDAVRRDPWHGLAALAWIEFRALEAELARTAAAGADARAAALRAFALVSEHPSARPADLIELLSTIPAQPQRADELAPPAPGPARPDRPAARDS
jgi:Bacterial protein of unknown function (DUF885)